MSQMSKLGSLVLTLVKFSTPYSDSQLPHSTPLGAGHPAKRTRTRPPLCHICVLKASYREDKARQLRSVGEGNTRTPQRPRGWLLPPQVPTTHPSHSVGQPNILCLTSRRYLGYAGNTTGREETLLIVPNKELDLILHRQPPHCLPVLHLQSLPRDSGGPHQHSELKHCMQTQGLRLNRDPQSTQTGNSPQPPWYP